MKSTFRNAFLVLLAVVVFALIASPPSNEGEIKYDPETQAQIDELENEIQMIDATLPSIPEDNKLHQTMLDERIKADLTIDSLMVHGKKIN